MGVLHRACGGWRCEGVYYLHVCTHKHTIIKLVSAFAFPPTKPIYFFCVIFWGSSLIICTYGASCIDESHLRRLPRHPWSVELIAVFWWIHELFSSSSHKEVSLSSRPHFDSLCAHMKHLVAASRELWAIKTCTHQCMWITRLSVIGMRKYQTCQI